MGVQRTDYPAIFPVKGEKRESLKMEKLRIFRFSKQELLLSLPTLVMLLVAQAFMLCYHLSALPVVATWVFGRFSLPNSPFLASIPIFI